MPCQDDRRRTDPDVSIRGVTVSRTLGRCVVAYGDDVDWLRLGSLVGRSARAAPQTGREQESVTLVG